MLAGSTRLTYSLVVIMLETTQSLNLFIPMTFTVVVANSVGWMLTDAVYSNQIKLKEIPLLETRPEEGPPTATVEQIMSKDLVSLSLKSDYA